MIWEKIWSSDFRILVITRNSLDGPAYQALINQNLFPICDEDFFLLQDNAPPHKSASTMSFLEENDIMLVLVNDWPPHLPDLNVIENVSNMLGDKREGKEFTHLNALWSFSEKQFYLILFRTATFKSYLNPY